MVRRRGQLSTYLKPLVAILMAILFLILILITLRFGTSVKEQRASFELQSQAPRIRDHILNCFSVGENYTKAEIVLNRSKLEYLNQFYNYREPECAEDFNYGWNASIKLEYLPGVEEISAGGKASVVLIIDRSGSMSQDPDNNGKSRLEEVKEAAVEFVDLVEKNVKVGIVVFSGTEHLVQTLTSDKDVLKEKINSVKAPFGATCLGCGIHEANRELEQNGEGNLYEILLTDGCPYPSPSYDDDVKRAQELGIIIHTIGFQLADQLGCKKDEAVKHLDTIADSTGGKRFLAENLKSLKEVYDQISREIKRSYAQYGLAETTCSLNPLVGYHGNLDLAFIIDRSLSMDKPSICNYIDNIVKGLEEAGINVVYKVYGMADQPRESFGWFTVRGMWKPQCMDEKTNWTDNFAFNKMKDAKPEGWGPSSSWVLDKFPWRKYSKKIIAVFGDHDPTGGCDGSLYDRLTSQASLSSPQDFELDHASLDTNCVDYHGDVPIENFNPWKTYPGKDNKIGKFPLDSEVEIMSYITAKAKEKGVSIYFLRGLEYLLKKQYKFGDNLKNDAVEAMENVSEETGGKVYLFSEWDTFLQDVKDLFLTYDVKEHIDTCPNVVYTFGEEEGSFDRALDDKITLSFPASVMQNEKLIVPALVKVEVRKGDLEQLVGAINRVYKIGRERKKDFTSTLEITLNNKIIIGDTVFKRPKKVEYTLSGGPSPLDYITVDEDIRVGVNGEEVFSDADELATSDPSSTYDGRPIKFPGLIKDAFQVLATNFHEPTLELGPLFLHCCNGKKQQIAPRIFADKRINETLYNNLNKDHTFYHNFTTINIGEYEKVKEKGICMISGSKKSCVGLRTNAINSLELEPGHYFLKIKYIHPDVVEVTK